MRSSVLSITFLVGVAALARVAAAADPPAAWNVHIVTKAGMHYDGVIMRTPKVEPIFAAEDGPKLDAVPADLPIEIRWFNGLNGSIGVRAGKIKSIEVKGTLADADVKTREQQSEANKEDKWKAELERLQIVQNDRTTRALAEADAAAAAAAEALRLPEIPADLKPMLEKYPPEQGWVPAKKDELYHQTVILNSRPLTEQERQWLDEYDDWKPAFDAWFAREQRKIELEQKAKEDAENGVPGAASQPAPTGAAKPEPSGTAKSEASNTDPDHPTQDELALLPKRLDPGVPKPIKIDPKTKKPVGLDPGVAKPTNLTNGERP